MSSWAIVITLFASLCSAAMGAAWLLGVRALRQLWWVSATAGAIAGSGLSWWGGGSAWQLAAGAAYGVVLGTGTWVLLWAGVRPYLKELARHQARSKDADD